MIQNQEYIQEFIEEAKSHLESMEATLLNATDLAADSEAVNDVFRAVHSIKGTAGFFGLKKIVALAHAMENVFGEIRSGRCCMTETMAQLLLEANDRLRELVENVLLSEDQDVADLVEQLDHILKNQSVPCGCSLVVEGGNQQKIKFDGNACDLLRDGLKHGHRIFQVRLRINRDLLNYSEGPVKLFKKLEAVSTVIDSKTDMSEINSLEDVMEAVKNRKKDVWLGVLVTTVLEREMFADAIGIREENITPFQLNIEPKSGEASAESAGMEAEETIREPQPESGGERQQGIGPSAKTIKFDDSIRVNVSILNDLLDMAGEMVLGRNQLLRTLESYRKSIPGLGPILQNIDRLTTGMQERIMLTRMQPVANVFNKFPRIIREISRTLGKEIQLGIEGAEVELDKSMIEALTDPLTHLVRNSADHGIESLEGREKAGKSACGKIILRAYHEGGYVNIDVIDDGKGLDLEKVKKTALEKDIVSLSQLEHMSEADILKLVFRPGFSTAEKISDLSGRGVGMDVVKTNIEKLGGSVEIFTFKGQGTTIRLMLPLTLAIIQSLIVEVEGHRFALPQVNLREIVRVKPGDANNRIEVVQGAEVMRLRGRLLPVVHLADILDIPRTYRDIETGERLPERRKYMTDQRLVNTDVNETELLSRRHSLDNVIRVLVLKIGNRMFGIAVDSIIGGEETLVKPLPVYLKECLCYSGVTILGDGKTAVILDLEGMIRLADLKFRDDEAEEGLEESRANDLVESQNLLLFKCSGTETLALDLAVVSRVEEVKAAAIEVVGDKEYIQFNGGALRVIRPEDYLPVSRVSKQPDKYYVIIPKLVSYPIGILIEKIHDNIQARVHLNTEDIISAGLIGSAVYNHRLLLLINIYELFELADPQHYRMNNVAASEAGRVLLVEDTQFFQRIEQKYLEGAGYQVTLAQNGKEALELLATGHFDIVVSDIHMPVMSGLELVKSIRNSNKYRDLPVVALTSITEERLKQAGLESGFDFFEWKLDRDSLLRTMDSALQTRRRKAVV